MKKIIKLWTNRKLLNEVKDLWDPSDQWCGGLVSLFHPLYRHYAVALNNDHGISWCNGGKAGGFSIHDLSRYELHDRREEGVCQRATVRQHIEVAIKAFNNTWVRELCWLNCEHVARLITTKQAHCSQWRLFCAGSNEQAEGDFWKAMSELN